MLKLLKYYHPKNRLIKLKISNQEINDSLIKEANSYLSIYIILLLLLLGWLVLACYEYNPIDSLFDMVSAQVNVGLSTEL